jgi:glycosyltransferase involved in cell wall biosynthesis
MRVLLVHQPVDGGVARHVADIRAGLHADGHEVITCGPARIPGLADLPHVELELVRSIAVGRDLAAVRSLRRVIRDLAPDVIHAHSSKAGAVARVAAAGTRCAPVLYTPHGYAFAGHFTRVGERSVYRRVERALAPLTGGVLCVCEAEATLARAVTPHTPVAIVPNGVPLPGDGPVNLRVAALAARGPVLATLSMLRAGKGVETLLDAMPELLRAHPDAQLAVCGDGPERASLQDRAAALGVAGAVHFLGAVSDPLAALRPAHVFAFPSWTESLPYALLEAMSLGLPCVASDVGGIGEAMRSGREGLLVAPRDAAGLAGALRALLGHPAQARALGAAARARVAEHFSLERMVSALERAYMADAPGDGSRSALVSAGGLRDALAPAA